jgi:hypothetical protein
MTFNLTYEGRTQEVLWTFSFEKRGLSGRQLFFSGVVCAACEVEASFGSLFPLGVEQ